MGALSAARLSILAWAVATPARAAPSEGVVSRFGEIAIVPGDRELVEAEAGGFSVRSLSALTSRVLAAFGDRFQTVTVWLTFEDRSASRTQAYAVVVKSDVTGIGMPVFDEAARYGSAGALRAVVNMTTIGLRAGETPASWRPYLELWGQEAAHRFGPALRVRDPRTGAPSDLLLGRACTHYRRFVDSGDSVHDGASWTDNRDGTFTRREGARRYGPLDLYAMGLVGPDEVPPFFVVDAIPGYAHPPCGAAYEATPMPLARTIAGRRVDLTIDDVLAANGPRLRPPDPAGGPEDYVREALVILTRPGETAESPLVQRLAARLEGARARWETWNREASGGRLFVCTRLDADCGDARADVAALRVGGEAAGGRVPVEVTLTNAGVRAATEIRVGLEVAPGGAPVARATTSIAPLEPGETRVVTLTLDLRGARCGGPLSLVATADSALHRSRRSEALWLGAGAGTPDGGLVAPCPPPEGQGGQGCSMGGPAGRAAGGGAAVAVSVIAAVLWAVGRRRRLARGAPHASVSSSSAPPSPERSSAR